MINNNNYYLHTFSNTFAELFPFIVINPKTIKNENKRNINHYVFMTAYNFFISAHLAVCSEKTKNIYRWNIHLFQFSINILLIHFIILLFLFSFTPFHKKLQFELQHNINFFHQIWWSSTETNIFELHHLWHLQSITKSKQIYFRNNK